MARSSSPIPHTNLNQSSTLYRTLFPESYSSYKKSPSNQPSSNNNFSSIVAPPLQKPYQYNLSTVEQQPSSTPCHLPCCSNLTATSNERMIYRPYSTSDSPKTLDSPKLSSSIKRKQRQTKSTPYPLTKPYLPPPYNHPPQSQNQIPHKTDIHRSIPPAVTQNSSTLISPPNTPNDLTLPNICTRSIDLTRAIALHGQCNMDKIPKLVVRHSKTYANKTIDTMGQLFPSWFTEPDYRCIHCFNCDRVFTPQQFMLHVDDEKLEKEQLSKMTSIQLLTSEKMSVNKVAL
jgi:hypothetical protein